jgi:hypothetical protein
MEKQSWESHKLIQMLCPDMKEEFPIATSLDLKSQRVIHIDVERTRNDELTPNEKVLLENILTFYCKDTKTQYKQGMNEVVIPFLLTCRKGLPIHIAYLCYKQFINICLKTMFSDDVSHK